MTNNYSAGELLSKSVTAIGESHYYDNDLSRAHAENWLRTTLAPTADNELAQLKYRIAQADHETLEGLTLPQQARVKRINTMTKHILCLVNSDNFRFKGNTQQDVETDVA